MRTYLLLLLLLLGCSAREVQGQKKSTKLLEGNVQESENSPVKKVILDTKDRWIGEKINEFIETMCTEAGTIGSTFVEFKKECDDSLENMEYHFDAKNHLLGKSHFAQVLSRHALVSAVARRAISASEKAPMMQLSALSVSGSDFEELDRSMHLSQIRIINARDKTKELMSSEYFSNSTLARSASLSRFCAESCKRTVKSVEDLVKSLGLSRRTALNENYEEQEMTRVAGPISPICNGAERTLPDMLDSLAKEARSKLEEWTEPVRTLARLWTESNQLYANDKVANTAALEWSISNSGDREATSATAWGKELDAVNNVKDAILRVVEHTQHRERASLAQYGKGNDDLDTVPDERHRALLEAEESVSTSTLAVLTAYEHYAAASEVMYTAMLKGSPEAAVDITKKHGVAVNKLSEAVVRGESVVEKAATVAGRWKETFPSASLSVSTARASTVAPNTAIGRAAVAVQKTRGYADEVALAARSGDKKAVEAAESHLSKARQELKDKLAAAAGEGTESPVANAVDSFKLPPSKKTGSATDRKKGIVKSSGTPDRVLSQEERIALLQDEVRALA